MKQRILRCSFDWDPDDINILLSAKLAMPLMGTARIVVNSIHVKGNVCINLVFLFLIVFVYQFLYVIVFSDLFLDLIRKGCLTVLAVVFCSEFVFPDIMKNL